MQDNIASQTSNKISNRVLLALTVIIAMIGLLAYPAYLYLYKGDAQLVNIKSLEDLTETALSGTLFSTLAPKEKGNPLNYSMVYEFNSGRGVEYTDAHLLSSGVGGSLAQLSFSPDGGYATFLGSSAKYDKLYKNNESKTLQIYRAKINETTDGRALIEDVKAGSRSTEATSFRKSSPSINDRGEILYFSHRSKASPPQFSPVEEYDIKLVSTENISYTIATGTDPKWISNDKFAFLKNDGVYIYDLSTDTEELAIKNKLTESGEYPVTLNNNHLNVSKNGKYLAITNPDTRTVHVFYNEDINTYEYLMINYIENVTSFWPVFSPTGEYLVIQTADTVDIKNNPMPKLKFYVVDGTSGVIGPMREMDFSIDLDAYYQDYMFVDDWIL